MSISWSDALFFIAPTFIIAGAIYLLVKNFFDRDYKIKLIETKRMIQKDALPLRLQAYERLVLFLERISPNNLLIRSHQHGMTAKELQTELISTIRSEFEHNITQQIYMTSPAWIMIRNAREDVIRIINMSAQEVAPDATGVDLSKKIFDKIIQNQENPVQKAIDFIKAEVSQLF